MRSARLAVTLLLAIALVLLVSAPLVHVLFVGAPVAEGLGIQLVSAAHIDVRGALPGVDAVTIPPQLTVIAAACLLLAALSRVLRARTDAWILRTSLLTLAAAACLTLFIMRAPMERLSPAPEVFSVAIAWGAWLTNGICVLLCIFCFALREQAAATPPEYAT